jgi:hypothetical protein
MPALVCVFAKLCLRLPGSSGRGNFSCTTLHAAEEGEGGLGPNWCANKVQITLTISDMDAKSSWRRDNRPMVMFLEHTAAEGTPAPCQGDSKKARILAHIRHGQGYVEPPKQGEALWTLKARVYETLRMIKLTTEPPRNMRITVMYPTTDWERACANLHATWAADAIEVNWFKVIHNILSTNERLHAIRLVGLPRCSNYGEHDTAVNAECNEKWY